MLPNVPDAEARRRDEARAAARAAGVDEAITDGAGQGYGEALGGVPAGEGPIPAGGIAPDVPAENRAAPPAVGNEEQTAEGARTVNRGTADREVADPGARAFTGIDDADVFDATDVLTDAGLGAEGAGEIGTGLDARAGANGDRGAGVNGDADGLDAGPGELLDAGAEGARKMLNQEFGRES